MISWKFLIGNSHRKFLKPRVVVILRILKPFRGIFIWIRSGGNLEKWKSETNILNWYCKSLIVPILHSLQNKDSVRISAWEMKERDTPKGEEKIDRRVYLKAKKSLFPKLLRNCVFLKMFAVVFVFLVLFHFIIPLANFFLITFAYSSTLTH